MKAIKIKFCDFWAHWNTADNFIVNTLKERYEIEFSENPDYIFFSNFNDAFQHMDYNDCVKIFYTQENIVPDFNYADYAIGYDYIDYEDRYLRYPIFLIPERYGNAWDLMKKKHILSGNKKDYAGRNFCGVVVSNGTGKFRNDVYEELCKYKTVNSGGKYKNNIGKPEGVEDKLSFLLKHKFTLCFENTSHSGYTTEKLVEAFAAQTIPIYWGDPKVTKIFNPEAFIDVTNCRTPAEITDKIIKIDCDDKKYMEMLKTPALNQAYQNYWDEKQAELKKFLFSIFDQDKETAIRRNLLYWGETYHYRYYQMRNAYLKENEKMKYRIKRYLKNRVRLLLKRK